MNAFTYLLKPVQCVYGLAKGTYEKMKVRRDIIPIQTEILTHHRKQYKESQILTPNVDSHLALLPDGRTWPQFTLVHFAAFTNEWTHIKYSPVRGNFFSSNIQ